MAKAAAAEERKVDPDEGKPADGGAPLFPRASSDWVAVQVERVDPVEEEGFLGRLQITATEQEIRGRWGGGRYVVRALNGANQFKTQRTISIAGDPLFVSEVNEQRWRRGLGHRGPSSAVAAPAPAFGMAEIIGLFQGMTQMQAAQQQAWMQAQAEQRRQEADDRRAAEQQRRDDDRRRDDERRAEENRREERRAKEEETARERDREFMRTMLELGRPAGGDEGKIQAFMTGMTTALKLRPPGGDGGGRDDDDDDEDPIQETIKGAVHGLVDSIRGRAAAASSAAAPPAAPPGPEPVTVTGQLGEELKTFVHKAAGAGADPNKLLAEAISTLSRQIDRKKGGSNGAAVSAAAAAVKAKDGTPAPTAG
jgi:hypothetical protein